MVQTLINRFISGVQKTIRNMRFWRVTAIVGLTHWVAHTQLFGTDFTKVGYTMIGVLFLAFTFDVLD